MVAAFHSVNDSLLVAAGAFETLDMDVNVRSTFQGCFMRYIGTNHIPWQVQFGAKDPQLLIPLGFFSSLKEQDITSPTTALPPGACHTFCRGATLDLY